MVGGGVGLPPTSGKMPVQSIICDTEKIRIYTAVGKYVEVLYSALSGTRLEQEAMLVEMLQQLLDYRQRRNTLPQGDPDRTTNPARPELFWDGQFLVSRPVTVVAAPWDETTGRYLTELRRTRVD